MPGAADGLEALEARGYSVMDHCVVATPMGDGEGFHIEAVKRGAGRTAETRFHFMVRAPSHVATGGMGGVGFWYD